jgi:hypothetical protein
MTPLEHLDKGNIMSFFYKQSNDENSKELYLKKLIYDLEIREPDYENLIDFYDAERYLYGRVNQLFIATQLDTFSAPLATINTTNTEQTDLQAVAFVVAAFNDLNEQFNKKLLSGEIDTTEPYLSKLEVKKAYQDPSALYNQYLNQIIEAMTERVQEENIKFDDFDQFMLFFDNFSQNMIERMPLTYSGFLKSKYCPMNVSGLIVEISDQSFANDEQKIADFKNSNNWLFYLNACRSYGFWVDSSNPFRMVANIGSEEMLEYARNTTGCRFTSTSDILSRGYIPAYVGYIQTFKSILYNAYNITKSSYLKTEMCSDGTVKNNIVQPLEYTFRNFSTIYDDTYFIKKYIDLRLAEEKLDFKSYEVAKIIKDTLSVAKIKGSSVALSSFEKVISQTYNYSGSLTDLINRDIVRKQEEEDVLSNT